MTISNSQLAQQVSDLVNRWDLRETQMQAWIGGAVNGGPADDGRYPLTDVFGVTRQTLSPAQLEENVGGTVASGLAYSEAAQASSVAAGVAQALAEAARNTALTYRDAAQAARDLALTYRDTAGSHSANASTYATNSATSATASATSATASATSATNAAGSATTAGTHATNAGTSATNASNSATAAAASAVLAATFEPASYLAVASYQALTPTWTGRHIFNNSNSQLVLQNTSSGTDAKNWLARVNTSGTFVLSVTNDAAPGTAVADALVIARSGTTVSSVAFPTIGGDAKFMVGVSASIPSSSGIWTAQFSGGDQAGLGRAALFHNTNSSSPVVDIWSATTSGNNTFLNFNTETTRTSRGSISYNRGSGVTAYNTTSDRRLKQNIEDADEAGTVIDSIQVRQYDWKETGYHVSFGFIAQELDGVAPEAVNVGDAGETIERTWGIDPSKLVPLLVKELQSLRARVAALEAAQASQPFELQYQPYEEPT